MSKKKKKSKLDIAAIVIFTLVFALFTTGFTLYSLLTEEEEYHHEAIENGEPVADKKDKTGVLVFETNEEDERLSRDMTPIVVDEDSPFYEAFKDQDRVNVLLIGLADNMTDTIMVASYDMENQKVSIISIPRDTYYFRKKTDNEAENKINCFYRTSGKYGGAVGLAGVVSEILYGMPIHYYAIVEYDDIRAIMDVIGGVEVDVPFHMKYDDTTKGKELHIDIPAGPQIIDSSNVVEFLRFRHTNPSYAAKGYKSYQAGDIQRTETQRQFVQSVMKQCLKKNNLIKVAECAMQNIQSDLTYATAIKVARKAAGGLSAENINMYAMPGTDSVRGGLSFWEIDKNGIYSILEEVYGITGAPAEEAPADGAQSAEKEAGQ